MMMSAPVPDWIAEVMRDCRSLALTVSTLRLKPSAFLHSWVMGPFSSTSDAESFRTLRRAMRAMISSRHSLCAWYYAMNWNYASSRQHTNAREALFITYASRTLIREYYLFALGAATFPRAMVSALKSVR